MSKILVLINIIMVISMGNSFWWLSSKLSGPPFFVFLAKFCGGILGGVLPVIYFLFYFEII